MKTVSYIGSGLLLANYIFAIALSVQNPTWFNQPLMVGFTPSLPSSSSRRPRRSRDAKYARGAIQQYYRDIWALFYSEYLLFPWI